MQELIGLGIDTSKASAFYYPNYGDYYEHPITKKYVRDVKGYNPYPSFVNGDRTLKDLNLDLFPTFTLQDILEMLPKTIEAFKDGSKLPLMITITGSSKYAIVYCNPFCKNGTVGLTIHDTLLEAAFNMLKWCKQNNYV